MHLVHVEPNLSVRKTLKAALTAAQPGIHLQQFDNGQGALSYIVEHLNTIDGLVLVFQLPGTLSGLELAQHTRLLGYAGAIFFTSEYAVPSQSILAVARCEYIPPQWSTFEVVRKILEYEPVRQSTGLIGYLPKLASSSQPRHDVGALTTEQRRCRTCNSILTGDLGICLMCGTIVKPSANETTHRVSHSSEPSSELIVRGSSVVPDYAVITLLVDNEQLILPQSDYVMLGRVHSQLTTVQATIDLSRFHAQDLGVSRQHARIDQEDNAVYIMDLGSTNGTFLNNEPLPSYEKQVLHNGDIIRLGRLEITVQF
jgi:hypothetical protein